ncbi:MAG: hypothetical protein A2Z96_05180 [Spirochaetes bacterium GWB1_48_6]|nr:MAG: hypothetical protein A2Z96_05180 [Spirochaetes bacterium GWB1_48_6]
MWSFEEPGAFLLLLFIPLLIWLTHFWRHRGGLIIVAFGIWNSEPHPAGSRRLTGFILLGYSLWWSSLVFMIIALAGPVWIERDKIYLSQGIDIMIVLDESPSMAAQDFPPDNRFQSAITTVESFIRGRENDAIGLVTFAKDAALQVPPTLDYEYLLERLKNLKLMSLGNGSSLGLGLAYGVLHLQNTQGKDRVIIALTDGEYNAGEIHPETAAQMIRSLGIKLYIIGIGTEGRVPIELDLPDSDQKLSGTLEGGFDEEFLKSLVSGDRGAYFSATSSGNLEAVFRAIDTRESNAKRIKVQVTRKSFYEEILLLGLLLALLSLGIRKLILKELL